MALMQNSDTDKTVYTCELSGLFIPKLYVKVSVVGRILTAVLFSTLGVA